MSSPSLFTQEHLQSERLTLLKYKVVEAKASYINEQTKAKRERNAVLGLTGWHHVAGRNAEATRL